MISRRMRVKRDEADSLDGTLLFVDELTGLISR
jgi:hypothetical protein